MIQQTYHYTNEIGKPFVRIGEKYFSYSFGTKEDNTVDIESIYFESDEEQNTFLRAWKIGLLTKDIKVTNHSNFL